MRIKILITDDELPIVESLSEILETAGYEVAAATSGQEAIAKAAEFCPHLLLSDVLMPKMNGFELALQIKKMCPRCLLLLFSGQAVTARLAQDFIQTFTERGYRFELLPKPLHPEALLKKLEESLISAA